MVQSQSRERAWKRSKEPGRNGRLRQRLAVESLEDRQLLSGIISDFPLLTTSANVRGIASGHDGNVWFTEASTAIAPVGQTAAPTFKIGRISPSGSETDFPVSADTLNGGSITAGSDGALWFSEATYNISGALVGQASGKIGRITSAGVVTTYELPTPNVLPGAVTLGPDNNVWFTELNRSLGDSRATIGRITPGGSIKEFAVPSPGMLGSIKAGPDGNLWFTLNGGKDGSKIGKITPAGAVTEYSIPTSPGQMPPQASLITAGVDGNLWFSEEQAGKIGKITPAGAITEYPIPGSPATSLATGPDHNVWFTFQERGAVAPVNRVGQISPSGVITTLPENTSGVPRALTAGPDGNLWFADQTGRIGQIDADSVPITAASVLHPATSPPLLPIVGKPIAGVVASFTDASLHAKASDFASTIDWGDHSTSTATVMANTHGGFDVIGSHTYDFINVRHDITVTVQAADGASITLFNQTLIVNPNDAPSTVPTTGTVSKPSQQPGTDHHPEPVAVTTPTPPALVHGATSVTQTGPSTAPLESHHWPAVGSTPTPPVQVPVTTIITPTTPPKVPTPVTLPETPPSHPMATGTLIPTTPGPPTTPGVLVPVPTVITPTTPPKVTLTETPPSHPLPTGTLIATTPGPPTTPGVMIPLDSVPNPAGSIRPTPHPVSAPTLPVQPIYHASTSLPMMVQSGGGPVSHRVRASRFHEHHGAVEHGRHHHPHGVRPPHRRHHSHH